MDESIPQGIRSYIYSPTIQQTQLVIEVNNPNLPSSWEALILKLAEIHKDKAFSLTNYEERLFNQLLTDTPPPQPGISVEAKSLLDQRNVVIKLLYKNENLRWNLPPKSNNFVGRTELLEKMEIHFNKDTTHNPLLLTACHGLGGVGKTQLALEFCWRNDHKYQNICWFSAETEEQLINDYINLGKNELHILSLHNKKDKRLPKEKAIQVRNWLQKNDKKPNEWLLIYDNAPNHVEIADLLPNRGNVLITSRYTNWAGKTLSVDVFTLDEAREFIKNITGIKDEYESMDQLIETLGALPLALAQACAYIKENDITIKEYLDLYQEVKSELLSEAILPSGDEHESVMVTWNITFKKMKKECPESIEFMYCSVFFHHKNIPDYLLKSLFSEKNEALLTLKYNKAKAVAKKYSMINADNEKKLFSIHCVVQEVIKIQLEKENKFLEYLKKSAISLIITYPYAEKANDKFKQKRELLMHLEEVSKNLEISLTKLNFDLDQKQLELIFIYLNDAHEDLGEAQKHMILLKKILPIFEEKIYDKKHIKVGRILFALARTYDNVNAYNILGNPEIIKENLKAVKENILQQEKVSGTIAIFLYSPYTQTRIALLEQVLPIFEEHYRDNPYQYGLLLSTLGSAYGDSRNSLKQNEFTIKALRFFEKYMNNINSIIVAADHYEVANTLRKLSESYDNSDFQVKLLKKSQNLSMIYDKRDYNTINLRNIGIAHLILGDIVESKFYLETTLALQEELYDKDDLCLVETLKSLGNVYNLMKDIKTQKKLYERALCILKIHYGNNHPEVTEMQSNIECLKFLPQNKIQTSNSIEPIDNYDYLKKIKIEDSNLITYLKEKTPLKFFGVRDEEYTVDAVAEIMTETDKKAAKQLQQGLNGYGRFFKMSENKEGFVLEGINISEKKQTSTGIKIQNYLFRK